MNQKTIVIAAVFGLTLLLSPARATAQTQNPQPQTTPAETGQNQGQAQSNLEKQFPNLGRLNLTPDQIAKIRAINAEMKDQRQTVNRRLVQARLALAEAVEAPTPNQALIEQRSRELAEAQGGMIRLRALVEARVMQEVLTPEQRATVIEMRQRNEALRRGGNQQLPRAGLRRQQGLQRNPNQTASPKQPKQKP